MKLMNHGVAVRPDAEHTQKVGAIVIPDTVKSTSKQKEGMVLDVGPGTEDKPMEVRPGDKIVYKNEEYPQSEGCDIIGCDDIMWVID